MSKFIDLTGNIYSRLTVVSHSHTRRWETSKQSDQYWNCICSCGNSCVVRGASLKSSITQSCGCLRLEALRDKAKHKCRNNSGLSKTNEYSLWAAAKERAVKYGRDFNLEVSDIVIPKTCPVLGIALVKGVKKQTYSSPTLDRIDSSKGYTKNNVCVISQRANSLKQDASIETIERLLNYMRRNT